MMNSMLHNLNEKQKEAVKTTNGPVLVLSGAGTGKTQVLTTRISYIMSQNLATDWQILALTFTNKAALEMKNRIAKMIPDHNVPRWCGTFHSVCLRILRANNMAAGLRDNFLIFDEEDQKKVLKEVLAALNYDGPDDTPANWVEKISLIKDKGFGYKPVGRSEKVLNAYNRECDRLGGVDFGDIILKVLELFNKHPEILEKYKNQFKYILVDEFQDTNNSQHQLLNLLSSGHNNICCVGDDDQSIYSWRGAEIKHILNFEKTYPNASVIRLETNYRSTGNILGAANSLIKNNNERLGKDLSPAPNVGDGDRVQVLTLPTDRDEARLITDAIIKKSLDKKYSDFAILIRSGNLVRTFEEKFNEYRLPFRVIGAQKFYERMEIKDVIAYIRLLVYPFDDLSFMRVIAKPRRGFGDKAIAELKSYGLPLMDAMRNCDLKPAMRKKADEFLSSFDFDWQNMTPRAAAEQLLENSGYLQIWRDKKDEESQNRLQNIRELLSNVISSKESLADFLEEAVLNTTDDDDVVNSEIDAINIMTIHAAKGLEFDTVFLPAWEEGIFPNKKALDTGDIEEERRLAYVAITRGRNRVIISNAMSRFLYGETLYNPESCFIPELDKQYVSFAGTNKIQTSYANASPKIKPKLKLSRVGKLVSHTELGSGVVIEDSTDILTIAFKNSGIKKVASDFVKFLS